MSQNVRNAVVKITASSCYIGRSCGILIWIEDYLVFSMAYARLMPVYRASQARLNASLSPIYGFKHGLSERQVQLLDRRGPESFGDRRRIAPV